MTRSGYLAAAFVAVVGAASAAAQYDVRIAGSGPARPLDDPKPVYKYELKPADSEFLVVVHTFRGSVAGDRQVKELAEGLAEWIRTECKLYAYVHERGWTQRRERDKEKEIAIAAMRKYYTSQGESDEQIESRIRKMKLARIPDEYVILVAPGKGALKTRDEANAFAKYVQKLPAPPAEFCESVVLGGAVGEAKNPFATAIAGLNPTIPKKEVVAERPKADDFLLRLNAGQPYSLIHKTKKPFTLVVQTYGSKFGLGRVVKPGEMTQVSTKADGEMLERAAQQANAVAKMLRARKHDAYVLHTQFESFICIGDYDSKDDPQLLANAKAFASLPLRDDNKGTIIETFMEKPMPALIPRP